MSWLWNLCCIFCVVLACVWVSVPRLAGAPSAHTHTHTPAAHLLLRQGRRKSPGLLLAGWKSDCFFASRRGIVMAQLLCVISFVIYCVFLEFNLYFPSPLPETGSKLELQRLQRRATQPLATQPQAKPPHAPSRPTPQPPSPSTTIPG